jgi:hypothetical protein
MTTSWQARFPSFNLNPQASLQEEFVGLATEQGWERNGKRYREEWRLYLADQFGIHYGRDESQLEGWKALCAEVGVTNVPDSITGCKKASLRFVSFLFG